MYRVWVLLLLCFFLFLLLLFRVNIVKAAYPLNDMIYVYRPIANKYYFMFDLQTNSEKDSVVSIEGLGCQLTHCSLYYRVFGLSKLKSILFNSLYIVSCISTIASYRINNFMTFHDFANTVLYNVLFEKNNNLYNNILLNIVQRHRGVLP